AAPGIILTDSALKHCSLRFEVLAGDGQAERVDHAEGVEIRGGERRLGHVEVFRMGCVVTPIVGRPRPLSRHRHAQTTGTCLYTLICEEPLYAQKRRPGRSRAQADKRLDHEETDLSLSVVSSPLTGTRCIRPPDEPVGPGASAEAIARHRSAPPRTGPGGRGP